MRVEARASHRLCFTPCVLPKHVARPRVVRGTRHLSSPEADVVTTTAAQVPWQICDEDARDWTWSVMEDWRSSRKVATIPIAWRRRI